MTDVELAQIAALARCTFSPGSTPKRVVAQLSMIIVKRKDEIEAYELSDKMRAFIDRLAHQYRRQIGSCMSVACLPCNPVIDPADVRVALDAFIEGRDEYAQHLPLWRKTALARYNARHSMCCAHPYEYATKVPPSQRRATTRGDIYCRFCGELLFSGVKQPHKLVKESAEAQRHLTICTLQTLSGMREYAEPGHRAMPMEDLWRD